MMNKKPGMEIAIGVGRPKPLKGAPGMMGDGPDMPETPDQPDDDSDMKAWCDKTDALLKKIAEAVGVDTTEDEKPEGGDSGEMPSEQSGYDS